MNKNNILQSLLLILSALSIFLISRGQKLELYGFITGLICQPLWLITSYKNKQWGIFILALFYIYCNIYGIFYK
jgi:hypothetical protein